MINKFVKLLSLVFALAIFLGVQADTASAAKAGTETSAPIFSQSLRTSLPENAVLLSHNEKSIPIKIDNGAKTEIIVGVCTITFDAYQVGAGTVGYNVTTTTTAPFEMDVSIFLDDVYQGGYVGNSEVGSGEVGFYREYTTSVGSHMAKLDGTVFPDVEGAESSPFTLNSAFTLKY